MQNFMMKAAVCTGYKSLDALKIGDVGKPIIAPNEILIRVAASSVQTADWRIQSMEMPPGMGFLAKLVFGFSKPKISILGTEVSGTVEALGSEVKSFKLGDPVMAAFGATFGGHAEFAKIKDTAAICQKPKNLTFEEAACISFGGLTALEYLKYKTKLQKNENILITGASGSVGVAAIQIAKYLGAQITAVCSPSNFALVQSLGADHCIDYHQSNFWEMETKYDVIFDSVHNFSVKQALPVLKEHGRLVLITAGLNEMIFSPLYTLGSTKKVVTGVSQDTKERLLELIDLIDQGHLKSIIDKKYSLNQIKEAFGYVGDRHKRGNVVITL